ncbi:hypothetical protein [Burkholderia ubonensis]|uniref:hypothetical protein n=1 Tax=Burkholderia ubonensis TaxID=101571 RepID=UPI0015C2ED76|nr:hypothetical protein [Burkholderia ubonensis]
MLSADSSDATHRNAADSPDIDQPFDALSTSLEIEGFSDIATPCKPRSCPKS